MIAPVRVRVGGYRVDKHYMFKDLVIGLRRTLDPTLKLSLCVCIHFLGS